MQNKFGKIIANKFFLISYSPNFAVLFILANKILTLRNVFK